MLTVENELRRVDANRRELEAQMYWSAMRDGAVFDLSAPEFRDELDVLAANTTSPALRKLCAKNRSRFDGLIDVSVVAGVR